jgi:uncharacterized protein YehS (DUF1456 family)
MNNTIVQVVSVGTQEVLANARAALLRKEITQEQFNEIYNSCYHKLLVALAEQRRAEREQR